jgi:hypothetical protein
MPILFLPKFSEVSVEKRASLWGSVIVGFLGIILAINASLDSQFIGAGVSLIASAMAFGFIGLIFLRK